MSLPDVDFETTDAIFGSLDKSADELAKKMVLKINDAYYRIIDF